MGNARVACLGAFVLLLPVSVEIPVTSDSARVGAETRFGVYGGVGHYALVDRGCEGEILRTHPRDFHEVGGEFEQRFPQGPTIGARAGTIRMTGDNRVPDYRFYPPIDTLQSIHGTITYVNPAIGLEIPSFGLGMGIVLARVDHADDRISSIDRRPSFHLRFGSEDGAYLKVSSLENVPLYSGGGYTEFGFGLHPQRLWDLYLGVGSAPYDGVGLVVHLDRRVTDHQALSLRARLGDSGRENQSGIAVGWSYVSSMPRAPRPHRFARPMGSSWGLGPRVPEPMPVPLSRRGGSHRHETLPEYGVYQPVDSLPVVVARTDPVLSDSARTLGVTGTVTLAALIDEQGSVVQPRVLRSIPGLDEAAIECVRQWRFRPAIRDRVPVPYWLAIPISFPP